MGNVIPRPSVPRGSDKGKAIDTVRMRNSYDPPPGTGTNRKLPDVPKTSIVRQPSSAPNKRLKARYSFKATSQEELTFRTGSIMEVLWDDGDWWFAQDLSTKSQGYIPKNFFVEIDSLQELEWFHGNLDRKDAEKLLLNQSQGTFLVRESGSIDGAYALSVVDQEQTPRHYRIKRMDNGDFFLNSKNAFKDLPSFIDHYKRCQGLCCFLKTPCRRLAPCQNDLSRSTRDKWEVNRKLIELKEKIGTGNFGEVWKGMFNQKTVVAVKVMKKGSMHREAFLEEAKVMKQLRHPKLVKLFAVCSDDPIYIVTELMAMGCLQQFLRQDGGRTLSTKILIEFGAQVASGMQYIEAKNYVHRDLAARNVLVNEHNMLKIGDFGLTRTLSEDIYVATLETKFPVRWTAPEVFSSKMYGIKSDVWAFGILLVEIFTFGDTPYPGMSNAEVQSKLTGTYRHAKPANCSPEMYELMLTCWDKLPQRRPTFETLFNNLDDFVVANELAYM